MFGVASFLEVEISLFRHASYSRVDCFLTLKADLYGVADIKILPLTISDHAPLVLTWDIGFRSTTKQRRLNAALLNDKEFITFIKTELEIYLDTNALPETSPLML